MTFSPCSIVRKVKVSLHRKLKMGLLPLNRERERTREREGEGEILVQGFQISVWTRKHNKEFEGNMFKKMSDLIFKLKFAVNLLQMFLLTSGRMEGRIKGSKDGCKEG